MIQVLLKSLKNFQVNILAILRVCLELARLTLQSSCIQGGMNPFGSYSGIQKRGLEKHLPSKQPRHQLYLINKALWQEWQDSICPEVLFLKMSDDALSPHRVESVCFPSANQNQTSPFPFIPTNKPRGITGNLVINDLFSRRGGRNVLPLPPPPNPASVLYAFLPM